MSWDAIVIGGGPAGLSAALWLARYRRRVLVLDSGRYRNEHVEQAHGYLGRDPIDPADLRSRAREDLLRYDSAELRESAASSAVRDGDGFVVEAGGERLEARRLVVATGVRDVFPEVENFFDHYGVSVFHCPTCDGYEAKGRQVVVFGWSEAVAGFALLLLNWASSVTVVTDGRAFEGDATHRTTLLAHGVALLEDDAVRLEGTRGDLQGVRLRGAGVIPCQFGFFSIAHEPASDIADRLGCRRGEGECLAVDESGLTSVAGVYAAGDITPGLQLVQVAAAKGASAGVACALSLRPDLQPF